MAYTPRDLTKGIAMMDSSFVADTSQFLLAVTAIFSFMRSYRKSSHTVYDLKVHLIWITKYRYNVLTNEVGVRIREIIRQVCDSEWDSDH